MHFNWSRSRWSEIMLQLFNSVFFWKRDSCLKMIHFIMSCLKTVYWRNLYFLVTVRIVFVDRCYLSTIWWRWWKGDVLSWWIRMGKLFYCKTCCQCEHCNFKIPFKRKLPLPSYKFLISGFILSPGRNASSSHNISLVPAWRRFVRKGLEINTFWMCGQGAQRTALCGSSWLSRVSCPAYM